MLGSPAGPGAPSQRGLWASAPVPSATSFTTDGFSKYGVYSLFPGAAASFGSALYSHASTIGRFASGPLQPSSGNIFHTNHKDSLFSPAGYTFGAPTPPPGSPYSPIPVAQLDLLAKGFNSNIIIQQPDFSLSPKKAQIVEKYCDDKCCSLKQKPCVCLTDGLSKGAKYFESNSGCSRTNPIEWSSVHIKKEPGNPCQVAEITTSISPIVKVEVKSPSQKKEHDGEIMSAGSLYANGNIPVGIAVARQRVHHQEIITSPSLPPAGLLATVNSACLSEIDSTHAGMAASATMGGASGGALLQCSDDRSTALANWSMGGAQGSALATPTLWQYPAHIPMESMIPFPLPMPPVGVQLVRDPTSGGFLLLPTTTEPIQQAVVWPSYPQPSSVLLPPMPPPPLQLLSSAASDYLSSSTTLHQHTQTHSTRLLAVTTDSKRKMPMPMPATTLIKIETDGSSIDQSKAISTMASTNGTMYADQTLTPLVTTHLIYQHPTNLILSQPPTDSISKSQATSTVTCLTPPPEIIPIHDDEPVLVVQDASNQTDSPIFSEDDNTSNTLADVMDDTKIKSNVYPDKEDTEGISIEQIVPETDDQDVDSSRDFENVDDDSLTQPEDLTMRPVVTTEIINKPDLSGLELLSNSIVEFESCRKDIKIEKLPSERHNVNEVKILTTNVCQNVAVKMDEMQETCVNKTVDDNLGGLDLLCALAEQRILEENCKYSRKDKTKSRRKEKRKSRRHSDEPRQKKSKSDRCCSDELRRYSVDIERSKYKAIQKMSSDTKEECTCRDEKYKSYKTPQSEEEVKKFIASKTQSSCCKGEWPCMNAMELDMRMKLADLQRQYREKQKELSRLKPKKHHHPDCTKKKSRKKSIQSDCSDSPPPLQNILDSPTRINRYELLKPPTLSAIEEIPISKNNNTKKREEMYKITEEHWFDDSECEKSTTQNRTSSIEVRESFDKSESKSSSKKRKVGRPKKLLGSDLHVPTETIVVKKSRPASFVGYLLAAKEKLHSKTNTLSDSPPRYLDDNVTYVSKQTRNNNNNVTTNENLNTCKIRPKLKAEATFKSYEDEEHIEIESDEDLEECDEEDDVKSVADEEEIEFQEEQVTQNVQEEEDDTLVVTPMEVAKEIVEVGTKDEQHVCILTTEHLETDKLRVLTAMGGLFYAGHLNAVEPPDVYSITLDGERGNRPHIMSREEILRDAIVEIFPKSTKELSAGTRLCAYWSQQYRCLYPGSVAEPGTPNPDLDSKFVAVEFDDGDSGRIALEDIRLLPSDYPIMEYDPNPLLSLSKRKRRISSSVSAGERRLSQNSNHEDIKKPKVEDVPVTVEVKGSKHNTNGHKERKRLKKKKREKLKQKLMQEGCNRKKRKKHKCTEENCQHKKHHKKHRKHKKHHHDKEETTSVEEKTTESEESLAAPEESEESQMIAEDEATEEVVEREENNIPNPEDEVTMDDIIEATQNKQTKKIRDRQESCESSRSKMSAFLPARQLWGWSGKGYKRPKGKGRTKKEFFKSIQRGKETITVGDSAVFLSTGRPDRPYIGRIEAMWEQCGTMVVKVKWFYHPEETVGCPMNLQYPGALFESPHIDENDVQTIAHKCAVLPLKKYIQRLGNDPRRFATIYDNNDMYYLAGYYDPTITSLKMEPEIPFLKQD